MNGDNEFEGGRMQNHHDDMHSENETQERKGFKAYAKPITAYKELQAPSSTQNTENNQRRKVEKPPLVRKS